MQGLPSKVRCFVGPLPNASLREPLRAVDKTLGC
jgi:hypothetical protein